MASDIWLRTILIVRKETRCRHIGYSFRLAARVLLYASSHRQDGTPVVEHWLEREIAQWVHPMKGRSDDPSHHERTLLLRSYISLLHTYSHLQTFMTRHDLSGFIWGFIASSNLGLVTMYWSFVYCCRYRWVLFQVISTSMQWAKNRP